MLFYEGGCINCGEPRLTKEEIAAGMKLVDRNVYVANDLSGELVLGLCGACFKIQDKDFDLAKIKANMLLSETTAYETKQAEFIKMELRSIRKRNV